MSQTTLTPTEIKRVTDQEKGSGIDISWSDGQTTHLSSLALRKACPCASCNELRGDTSHSKPLGGGGRALLTVISATKDEELDLEKLWPVGNYALGMRWADNHDSGIYTYSYLWELAQKES